MGMRKKTVVPAATFKALFQELIPWSFIYALLRRCGGRRRCPPKITPSELILGLVFHVVAEAVKPGQSFWIGEDTLITVKTLSSGHVERKRQASYRAADIFTGPVPG
jgi:hypothetical protein